MERIQKAIFTAVVMSEMTHIFCCVLPITVSVMGLLAGMGIMSALPTGVMDFHELMHDYEIPLLVTSAAVLALGWGLHCLSVKIDCRDTGCVHEPCGPVKRRSLLVLKIATILFVFNAAFYLLIHR